MKKFEDNGQWFKYCPHCKVIYPYPDSLYHIDKRQKDELYYYCKVCNNQRSIEWNKNNPEKKRKNGVEWYQQNKEITKQRAKEWGKNNPEKVKEKGRKYQKTEKGRINGRKKQNKRKRNLGYIELWENDWPEEIPVHGHHPNNLMVIPFPAITHMKTLGKNHRKDMNEMFKKYYMMDIDEIFSGVIK